tara:strand:- start:926 stop:2062 length:1137 start_codon:yes stop_codon:yes gene_type:complete
MKKFLFKITVFGSPLILVFLIPSIFLFVSGENYKSIDNVIKSKQDYLIGYAYNEGNYRYLKKKELESQKPQHLIALGSSRVLQFRDKMFTRSFYNAGYTISSIADFVPFINTNLDSNKSEVLLIALDQWMFNEDWDSLEDYDALDRKWTAKFNKKASIGTIFNTWLDFFSGKFGVEIIFNNPKEKLETIGLNALVNNTGFRKDGSMRYGGQIHMLLNNDSAANDFNYSDTYKRIKNGNRRFQFGKQVNAKAIQALSELLILCKNRGIYVIAFLPPFANKVNARMEQTGNYFYVKSIFEESLGLFEEYGFELWDMTTLDKYNSNDNEMIDGFHGGEVTYLKMLIYMIEKGSYLKEYTEINKLKSDFENRQNNYLVYPDN